MSVISFRLSSAQRLCCFSRTLLTSPTGFNATDAHIFRSYLYHERTGECSINSPIESRNTFFFKFQILNDANENKCLLLLRYGLCSVGKNYTASHFDSSSNGSWFILQRATQLIRHWSASSSFDGVERLFSQLDCINYFSVAGTGYSDRSNAEKERVYLGLQFQKETVHYGGNIPAAEIWLQPGRQEAVCRHVWSYFISHREGWGGQRYGMTKPDPVTHFLLQDSIS